MSNRTTIVLTRDGWIISGRDEVARRRADGDTTVPAYVVQVDYEGADEETRQRLHGLARELAPQDPQTTDGTAPPAE